MKFLIASDIHGSAFYVDLFLRKADILRPQKIILLGDIYYHGPRNELTEEYNPMKVASMLNEYNKHYDMIVIKGNCDAEVDEMISEFKFVNEVEIEAFGKIFMLTHGHKINIQNMNNVNSDVLLYGHFHVPFIEEAEGTIVASPGSISLPKDSSKNSYMTIDEDGITIYDLITDEVLMQRKFN